MKYKKSGRKIERERREVAATKSSINAISRIRFTDEEEDELLELYSRLVNIKLLESSPQDVKFSHKAAAAAKKESSSDEDSASSEESESEQEEGERSGHTGHDTSVTVKDSDENGDCEPNLSFTSSVSSSMTKAAFMRKLIRDDRFDRKHHGERSAQSAEVVAARLRRSLLSQQPGAKAQKAQQAVGLNPAPPLPPSSPHPPHTSHATRTPTPQTPKGGSVRVQVQCDGAGASKGSKLLVLERACSIEEVVATLRGKFRVSNKFNCLFLVADGKKGDGEGGKIMEGLDWYSLSDGATVRLCESSKVAGKNAETKANASTEAKSYVTANSLSDSAVKTPPPPSPSLIDTPSALPTPPAPYVPPATPYTTAFPSILPDPALSAALRKRWEERVWNPPASSPQNTLRQERAGLPIYAHKSSLLE
eukprot:gene39416-47979_t